VADGPARDELDQEHKEILLQQLFLMEEQQDLLSLKLKTRM